MTVAITVVKSFPMNDASMPNRAAEAEISDVPDVAGFGRRVAGNIRTGARIAYFRPFSASDFNVGAGQLFALVLINVLIAITYDYISIEPTRYFSTYGFMGAATEYLLFVFAVFVVASIQSDQGGTPRLVTAVFAILPAISIVALPLTYAYVQSGQASPLAAWLIWLALMGWAFAVVYRLVRDRYAVSKRRLVALVAVYALLSTVPRLFLQDVPFWYSYNPDAYADSDEKASINTEQVYYAQQELVENTAGKLAAQRPGISDLYFVGFGSYASQDVFMKEVNFVRNLFDTTYDTKGRSVALINNRQTVDQLPLANASNLGIILKKIAGRMDIEEDVLFLFLTSHGSKDAVLSVNFWPIEPNDLSAEALRDILAGSGIKWRILVISACYSGSFIETLADEHTLILTAAHENKTSFGCSNNRELTYFGEHYFARELHAGGSFVEAFHRARETLRERELSENIEASDPQIFIGSEMGEKLKELETRMQGAALRSAQLSGADSRHCHQNSALAAEGFATVHGEHVVEYQQVACLPLE